ncbi:MAG: hypothetical protein QM708_06390 [Propioniciclava sp.]
MQTLVSTSPYSARRGSASARAGREHRYGVGAGDPPGQVEEVHRLVTELAAGDLDVVERRHGRSATGQLDQFDAAHGPVVDEALQLGVVGVESAIEVHHHPGAAGVGDDLAGALDVQVDRLLTQDGHAGVHGRGEVTGVRVGGGGDEDRIDTVEGLLDTRRGANAVPVRDDRGPLGRGVMDRHEGDVGVLGQVPGVHRTDESGAEQGETLHGSFLWAGRWGSPIRTPAAPGAAWG